MDATQPKSPRANSKEKKQQVVPKKQKTVELKFEFLTQSRAEESAHLFTLAFLQMNTMWKQFGVSYDQVFSVMRGRMISCCQAGWNYALINPENNQLAAVIPSMDLYDYIDTISMPNNSEFNKVLGKYATELQKEYFENQRLTLKKGDAFYGYGGTIHPKYANGGVSRRTWAFGFVQMKLTGWKTYYCRASNRITTKVLTSFGARVVKVVHIAEQGIKGEFLELVRLDFDNLSYNSVKKYFEEKPEGVDEQQY